MVTNKNEINGRQRKWTETKGEIKSKWNRLSNEEIESLRENLGPLQEHLERAYGYSKGFAKKEYEKFSKHLVPEEVTPSEVDFAPETNTTIDTPIPIESNYDSESSTS